MGRFYEKDDYILVKRTDAAKFIKDFAIANYTVILFSWLAEIKQLEIHMDTDDVCRVLDITREQLFMYWRKGLIKWFKHGGVKFYSAYDVVLLAEKIHRTDRFRKLNEITGVTLPGNDSP